MDSLAGMLNEWHETRSISIANDICEGLWKEMEEFEDES